MNANVSHPRTENVQCQTDTGPMPVAQNQSDTKYLLGTIYLIALLLVVLRKLSKVTESQVKNFF